MHYKALSGKDKKYSGSVLGPFGITTLTEAKTEQQLRAIKQGARFICHSNDSSLLKDIMTTVFGALRNA